MITTFPSYILKNFVQRQMNDLEIRCLYKNTLPDFQIQIDNIVLDKSTMDTDEGTVE